MKNHPHLAELYTIYKLESQPFRKVHRMIDLFESIIKTHTVVIMSSYVNYNKLSDTAKGLLAQGLRTPSLGTWQLFSRELFKELESDGFTWPLASFSSEFISLDKTLNAEKTNVIAFRNNYAHGATPSDAQCEADIAQFEPYLKRLLTSQWLADSALEIIDHKVVLQCNKTTISLHPLLLHRQEETQPSIAFFNDIKNDKIGLLNYPLSKHYREKEFLEEFHHYLPLHEWKKTGNTDFYQRIEELTETFKGRVEERKQLMEFITTQTKGYCSIQGNPGIGKSALIAQFFKDIRTHKEKTNAIKVVEYFIRRGTQQAQVDYVLDYLNKRTDEHFPKGREIRAEGKMPFDIQNQLFAKWRLWSEHCEGIKLLFLIDGLDEGTENEVLKYLPRENFEHILIVYGSRPGGHKSIDELWGTLPVAHHQKIELSGLSKEDIRALIYEVANKYLIERDSPWIDAVQQRSEGNPLYLRLLCDAIENGSMHINNIHALPKAIDEYYKAILLRYANDPDGDALLDGLFTFTAAKDYLTIAHLGYINHLGAATLQRIGSTLKEVLYENPLTEAILDYKLFHESFREYLVMHNSKEIQEATERLIDFCATWNDLSDTWEQRYALEHYATHLAESKKANRSAQLKVLAEDAEYTQTQKHVLKHFAATQKLYRVVLEQANTTKEYDTQLQAALHLVDLRYEEQNDAPQVIALVASGNLEDLDLALKRIESFGGADEDGVKRRFILYMLCLMELTLLDSKDKPFSKPAIEKLLKHFNENIPTDHSILNWNEFFPSYLIHLISIELKKIDLNYNELYKRTNRFDTEWLNKKKSLDSIQIDFLLECILNINFDFDYWKDIALLRIASILFNMGNLDKAKFIIQVALSNVTDSSLLSKIATELFNQGKIAESKLVMQEAMAYTEDISEEWDLSNAQGHLSIELAKQGRLVEALAHARLISVESLKCTTLAAISTEQINQGYLKEADFTLKKVLKYARLIDDVKVKSETLAKISTELFYQGNLYESESIINETLSFAREIDYPWEKNSALGFIASELLNQEKVNESIICARSISEESEMRSAFINIYIELANQDKLTESMTIIQEYIASDFDIRDDFWMSMELSDIALEQGNRGNFDVALVCARKISFDREKSSLLSKIATELFNQGKIAESKLVMQEAIAYTENISDECDLINAQGHLYIELANQGRLVEALAYAREISFDREKSSLLSKIATELFNQGKIAESKLVMQEAIAYNENIRDEWDLSNAQGHLSIELAKQGRLVEALAYARCIGVKEFKCKVLVAISTELAKQVRIEEAASSMQEALACTREISNDDDKIFSLTTISAELAKQGQLEEAASTMQEALTCSKGISEEFKMRRAFGYISAELARQDRIEEAETVVLAIPQLAIRHFCWESIAKAALEKNPHTVVLNGMQVYKSDESRLFYLKGWADSVTVSDATIELVTTALPYFVNDTESIEKILQLHALHVVVFNTAPPEKIKQLNTTLNIQWFLDIHNALPQSSTATRLSTNLDAWLHEIEDEDDQDQITLWAKQVAKGKITEEEFKAKVNSI